MNFKIDKSLILEAQRHGEERLKFEYNRFGLSNDKGKSMILIGTIGQLLFKKYPSKRRFYGDDYKVPLRSLLSIKKLINNVK